MEKIITKTVEDKCFEIIRKYDGILVNDISDEDTHAAYALHDSPFSDNDFTILVYYHKTGEEVKKAKLFNFEGKNIDKFLVPYESETYAFYAWIEANSDHVDADYFHRWISNVEYDEYFFKLYAWYLFDRGNAKVFTPEIIDVTPDCKTITLAESIKNSFADVFDEDEFDKLLVDAFHTENSGQGVWLVCGDSSFYEKGYTLLQRADSNSYIIMVNRNIWQKVIEYVKGEGFMLWDGTTNVYGGGCAKGKRVTLY